MANEYHVSTVAAEVLRDASAAPARVTTIAAETLHSGQAAARVSTFAVEVLRSITSPGVTARRRGLIIG